MGETRWVDAHTAGLMLGVSAKRASNLAAIEKWRRRPNTRPAQFSYRDVLNTYHRRTSDRSTLTPASAAVQS
ncbi:hypothetical protein [Microcella sp.]|uniref:hypothetical protein n=1 Tax=Microcella sp. TaxID=1913979 RepID=UPI00391C7FFE